MPLFPTFRRPCPYQADLSAVMDGDWCRMCGQQVHDITDLSDAARAAVLGRCDGAICVSYRVPVAMAAAALAVSAAAPATAAPHGKHHGHRVTPPAPVVITLAGLPMMVPPGPSTPPATGATAPSPATTPSAGPRSSP